MSKISASSPKHIPQSKSIYGGRIHRPNSDRMSSSGNRVNTSGGARALVDILQIHGASRVSSDEAHNLAIRALKNISPALTLSKGLSNVAPTSTAVDKSAGEAIEELKKPKGRMIGDAVRKAIDSGTKDIDVRGVGRVFQHFAKLSKENSDKFRAEAKNAFHAETSDTEMHAKAQGDINYERFTEEDISALRDMANRWSGLSPNPGETGLSEQDHSARSLADSAQDQGQTGLSEQQRKEIYSLLLVEERYLDVKRVSQSTSAAKTSYSGRIKQP